MKSFFLLFVLGLTVPVAIAAPAKHVHHRHTSKSKAPGKKAAPRVDKMAVANCLKELRRLRSVATVGTTYNDYSARVVDAQVALDESAGHLSDSQIKSEMLASMSEFVEARKVWESNNDDDARSPELQAMLRGFRAEHGVREQTPQEHWTLAFSHLTTAEQLAAR